MGDFSIFDPIWDFAHSAVLHRTGISDFARFDPSGIWLLLSFLHMTSMANLSLFDVFWNIVCFAIYP